MQARFDLSGAKRRKENIVEGRSPLYISPQSLGSFFRRETEVGHPDSLGELVRYYPVALAFHSCMVPIGVPASMRTRTQTVNHLCIF